jgi:tRNA pseudouridine38-40 synthase
MTKIALGIEYQGTAYCGWQRQRHCDSVQARLEAALSQIAAQPIELFCAGRTDTGVHAIGQVAHFDSSVERPLRAWLEGSNTLLPDDIRVVWARPMTKDFHARFSAQARQYRYVIFNRAVRSAVLAGRVTWERRSLDEVAMHRAAQLLVGEHDFSSFRAAECQAAHARREIQSLSVTRRGEMVFIDIQANAFLHHMVRNIAGTLMQIGRGEQAADWAGTLLALRDRTKATATAPACGLYFVNAFYPEHFAVPRVSLSELVWQ